VSARGKFAIGGLALAAAAGGAVYVALGGCHVDTSVTEPHRERDLAADEVRAMLAGGDFAKKVEAGRQIDKLPPADRLRILLRLADDPDPAVRLLAARKLRAIDDPAAKATLARLATDDPDETVREIAGAKE
jgi:HEAT repeat protein